MLFVSGFMKSMSSQSSGDPFRSFIIKEMHLDNNKSIANIGSSLKKGEKSYNIYVFSNLASDAIFTHENFHFLPIYELIIMFLFSSHVDSIVINLT